MIKILFTVLIAGGFTGSAWAQDAKTSNPISDPTENIIAGAETILTGQVTANAISNEESFNCYRQYDQCLTRCDQGRYNWFWCQYAGCYREKNACMRAEDKDDNNDADWDLDTDG